MNTGCEDYRQAVRDICEQRAADDAIRVLHNDQTVTSRSFADVFTQIEEFKAVMDRLGLVAGSRVILLSAHAPSLFPLAASAAYWNVTAALVDPGIPRDELNEMIGFLDAAAIFASPECVLLLDEAFRRELPVLNIEAGVPGQGSGHAAPDAPDAFAPYPDISGFPHPNSCRPTPDPNLNAAFILLSSGTTGKRSAVMINHRSILLCTNRMAEEGRLREGDSLLHLFPTYHIAGIACGFTHFLIGNALDMVDTFNPAQIMNAIHTLNPSEIYMVPQLFDIMVARLNQEIKTRGPLVRAYYRFARNVAHRGLMKGNHLAGRRLMRPFREKLLGNNIRLIAGGGGPAKPETAMAIMELGAYWANVYASTEAGVPVAFNRPFDTVDPMTLGAPHSSGDVTFLIREPNEKGVGELLVKSDRIMEGYFRNPEATEAAFEDGWFKTGDLAFFDERGWLNLCGRVKESIVLRNGKKLAPVDLETILMAHMDLKKHPPVVVGVPVAGNDDYDEIHVFFEDWAMSSQQRDLFKITVIACGRDWAWAYPIKNIHFIDKIPRNAMMKPRRFMLRNYVLEERARIDREHAEADKLKAANAAAGTAGGMAAEMAASAMKTAKLFLAGATDTGRRPANVEAIVEAAIRKASGATQNIYPDTLLSDVGVDSLMAFEICSDIENQLGVFPEGAALPTATFQTYVDAVNAMLAKAAVGGQAGDGAASGAGEEAAAEPEDEPIVADVQYDTSGSNVVDKQGRAVPLRVIAPGSGVERGLETTPENGSDLLTLGARVARMGFNIEVRGLENVDISQNYLFAPNHSSYPDPLFVAYGLKRAKFNLRTIAYLVWEGSFGLPVFGSMMRKGNAVSTDVRFNNANSMRACRRWLGSGGSLILFPEGERTRTGDFLEFHTGAAAIASQEHVPVVPVYIQGAYEAFPPTATLPKLMGPGLHRRKIVVTFCEPINSENASPAEVTAAIEAAIRACAGEGGAAQ